MWKPRKYRRKTFTTKHVDHNLFSFHQIDESENRTKHFNPLCESRCGPIVIGDPKDKYFFINKFVIELSRPFRKQNGPYWKTFTHSCSRHRVSLENRMCYQCGEEYDKFSMLVNQLQREGYFDHFPTYTIDLETKNYQDYLEDLELAYNLYMCFHRCSGSKERYEKKWIIPVRKQLKSA